MRFSLFRQKIESRLKQAQSRRSKLRGSRLYLESLEQRRLLAGDTSVTSAHMDVNHDGTVSPLDALLIISDLNLNGSRPLSSISAPGGAQSLSLAAGGSPAAATNPALDVNQDGYISPIDALLVVKQLNDATAQIAITLQVTDNAGNPITQVLVGQQFEVRAFVQDVRANPAKPGVGAAYSDVTFDGSLASVSAIYHTAADDPHANPPSYAYGNSTSGNFATSGLIDEVGGFQTSSSPLGSGAILLWTAQMTATAGGVLTFSTDPADASPLHDSLVFDPPETVPTDAILYGTASVNVVGLPVITASPAQVTEGNSGTKALTFNLNLSGDNDAPVTVHYSTSDGTATSGGANPDYQAISDNVATFPAHTSSIQVTVNVNGDTLDEDDETFSLNLSNPSGATVGTPTVTGTIVNDDGLPEISIANTNVIEGTAASGATPMNFTVTLSTASSKTVTVPYQITPGTATAGTDYTATNGVLTFLPGQLTQTITVDVVRDSIDEVDETLNVALSAPTNATLGASSTAVGTITDDDAPPTISVSDATIGEPASGTSSLVFNVTLSAPSGQTVTVNYSTAGLTATSGQDFVPTTGVLTFAPGETTKTVTVNVNADGEAEQNETLNLLLSTPSNATIADGTGLGTITDFVGNTMIRVQLQVTDLSGNPITQILVGQQFELRAFVQDVRSNPAKPGVAAAYTDVTFNGALAAVQAIYHSAADDPNPNPPAYNYANSVAGDFSVSGLIDEAGGFQTSSAPLGNGQILLWSAKMTATAGGALTFTADPADVSPLHDSLVFDPPTIVSTDEIAYDTASVTVTDLPVISANSVQVIEGNSGTTPMTFNLNLSGDNSAPVTVHYSTTSGTATGDADYQAVVDNVATFPPHTSTIQITINAIGDLLNEDDETFTLNLFNASGASVSTPQLTGTIINDDAAPTVTIGNASVLEGTAISGTTPLTFTVTLSAASGKTITVPYTITPGTATVGTDYNAVNGVLTFQPGQLTQPITVNVVQDALNEANETVNVALSAPTNASLGAASTAVGTILNDDALPSISIDDQTVGEPASGTADMVFHISLSAPSGQTVTVNYVTTGITATANQDFVPTGGVLTFLPGETTKTVTVQINSDAVSEPAETLNLLLSGPVNATIADGTGVGTINDFVGDKLARIRLVATDLNGNPITSVLGGALFKLNAYVQDLRTPADNSSGVFAAYMDVDFNSAEFVGVGPITYGAEFQNVPGGAIVPGQLDEIGATATSIPTPNGPGEHLLYSVIVQGIAAGSGSFSPSPADAEGHGLLLYGASAPVPVAQVQYIGTDVIQVSAPSLINIDSPTIVEGNSGQKDLTFTITLSTPVSVPVTVNYATADSTAVGGSDYQITSNTLQFAAGQQTATVKVPIFGDTLNEANENFTLQLSAATNAIIQTGVGVGTIVNDDVAPTISVGNATGMEGVSNAAFQVTLSAPSGQIITVHYSTASQTATDGVDYTHAEGTLTFLPGQTAKTVTINVTQDAVFEGTETFLFNLSSPTIATLAVAQGIGSITELPGSYLNGYVYTDLNHNGLREAGELGIAGITITLTGTDFFGRAVTRQVTTDSNGLYQFNALVAGTYVLHEQAPNYVVDGVDTLGSIGGSIPANDTFLVTINSGVGATNYNFGEGGIDLSLFWTSQFT